MQPPEKRVVVVVHDMFTLVPGDLVFYFSKNGLQLEQEEGGGG